MRQNILIWIKASLPPSFPQPEASVSPSDLPSHIPHFTPPSAPLWTLCLSRLCRLIKVTFLPPPGLTLFTLQSHSTHRDGWAPVAKSVSPYCYFLAPIHSLHNITCWNMASLLILTSKVIKNYNREFSMWCYKLITTWHPPQRINYNQYILSRNLLTQGWWRVRHTEPQGMSYGSNIWPSEVKQTFTWSTVKSLSIYNDECSWIYTVYQCNSYVWAHDVKHPKKKGGLWWMGCCFLVLCHLNEYLLGNNSTFLFP